MSVNFLEQETDKNVESQTHKPGKVAPVQPDKEDKLAQVVDLLHQLGLSVEDVQPSASTASILHRHWGTQGTVVYGLWTLCFVIIMGHCGMGGS